MNKKIAKTTKAKPQRPQRRASLPMPVSKGPKAKQARPSQTMVTAPRMQSMANGDIRIVRREYLQNILAGSQDFVLHAYSINPGLQETFPWLSQVADNFEEYSFDRLSFDYVPVISTASQSGAMGSVVTTVLYNAASPNLDSYERMVEYSGAVERRICDPIKMTVDVSKRTNSGTEHYLRYSNAIPEGQDVKTYDIGKLNIAIDHVSTETYPPGTLLGRLYTDYVVVLKKPKMKNATVVPEPYRTIANYRSDSCVDNNMIHGTMALSSNNYDAGVSNNGQYYRGVKFYLQPGYYQIRCTMLLSATSSLLLTSSGGFSYLTLSGASGASNIDSIDDGVTPYESCLLFYGNVTANDAAVTIYPSSAGAVPTGWTLQINEIPQVITEWVVYEDV